MFILFAVPFRRPSAVHVVVELAANVDAACSVDPEVCAGAGKAAVVACVDAACSGCLGQEGESGSEEEEGGAEWLHFGGLLVA